MPWMEAAGAAWALVAILGWMARQIYDAIFRAGSRRAS